MYIPVHFHISPTKVQYLKLPTRANHTLVIITLNLHKRLCMHV